MVVEVEIYDDVISIMIVQVKIYVVLNFVITESNEMTMIQRQNSKDFVVVFER